MANHKKILFLPRLFLSALLFAALAQAAGLIFFFGAPTAALAIKPLEMNLQVPIPTLNGGETTIKFTGNTAPIASYVKAVYTYAIGIVGILAAVVLMIGGLMWITAGGNASNIGEAKAMITASLTGLILVLTSYIILSNVNPALVDLSSDITEITSGNLPDTSQPARYTCEWGEKSAVTAKRSGCVIGAKEQCPEKPDENIKDPECCCKYKPIDETCSWAHDPCITGYETIDGGSYTDNNLKTCGSETDNGELSYCCCKILEWNDWKFDPEISKQLGQADPALRTLLGCLRKNLSRTQGRISSISDSAVVYPETMDRCTTNYSQPPCDHARNSCHYGCGGNSASSCAVDFGDEENAAYIKKAAGACGAGYVQDEGNHIHISTKSCPKN